MEQAVFCGQVIRRYPEQYEKLPGRFVRKIEHDLDYLLQKQIPGLREIFLFGSAARGEIRSTSDIDLLIVTERKLENRELAAEIRWTLDEAIEGVSTDIVYTHKNAEYPSMAFQRTLRRDKKLILEVIE